MALSCALCQSTDISELQICSDWVGSFHSACTDSACSACLAMWIDSKLGACRAKGALEVPCFQSSCRRRIPHSMVLRFSPAARALADEIDSSEFCLKCDAMTDKVFCNDACQHVACRKCWMESSEKQAAAAIEQQALDILCCHPGCGAGCCDVLLSNSVDLVPVGSSISELTEHVTKARTWLQGVIQLSTRESPLAKGPTCPICQNVCVALLSEPGAPAPSGGDLDGDDCEGKEGEKPQEHAACEQCWVRWTEQHLDFCVMARSAKVPCLWPDCQQQHPLSLDSRLWRHCSTVSESIGKLTKQLDLRERLKKNNTFQQVDCPVFGCMGLGYIGFDTVMCFVCEHKWVPTDGEVGKAPCIDLNPETVLSCKLKQCPKCQEFIEKNGGCDHMTCFCKHQFNWTTLKSLN